SRRARSNRGSCRPSVSWAKARVRVTSEWPRLCNDCAKRRSFGRFRTPRATRFEARFRERHPVRLPAWSRAVDSGGRAHLVVTILDHALVERLDIGRHPADVAATTRPVAYPARSHEVDRVIAWRVAAPMTVRRLLSVSCFGMQ